MQPVVADEVAWSVKMAELIEMPLVFGLEWAEVGYFEFNVPFQHKYGYIRDERVDQMNHVLDGGPDAPCRGTILRRERRGPL